jgi:hypothetical protein
MELPEAERFRQLPYLAIGAYQAGNSLDSYKRDIAGAQASWKRARKYAQDALRLAPKFRNDRDYSKAIYLGNLALGMVALKEGDRGSAVRYMLAASYAPASEDIELYVSLHTKLTVYLLKAGERETVIEFLERVAQVSSPKVRNALLDSVDKIRKGIRPSWYPSDEPK